MYGRSDVEIKGFAQGRFLIREYRHCHLIIGIDETGGIPTQVCALKGDSDQDLQRLESLARDGIEPRITGLRMRALPIATGGYAIVVRIPRSWIPPHRVSARNTNRIYGRNSAGAYEFGIEELRVVFTSAASALDRARAFAAERLARIDAGEAIAPLAREGGRVVVHLVPTAASGIVGQINLQKAHAAQELLKPMGSLGFSPRINFDGFSNVHRLSDGRCAWSYTQVFRNGTIEAVKARATIDLDNGDLCIPALDFDRHIFERLLTHLSIRPPKSRCTASDCA